MDSSSSTPGIIDMGYQGAGPPSESASPRILAAPHVEDIERQYDPPPAASVQRADPGDEVVALATASFGGIEVRPFDAHRLLIQQMAVDYRENFWIIPTQERMPFPDSVLFSLACMFRTERVKKKRADWYVYIEDDISVRSTFMRDMRSVLDPETRPFIAAVGYVRNPPFLPAVWEKDEQGTVWQWDTAPATGLYRVNITGLAAAVFHRSLFDKLPQPWFGLMSNCIKIKDGQPDISRAARPDSWWCHVMEKAGIPVHVYCDVEATHFGMPMPVNRHTAPVFRSITHLQRNVVEDKSRGLA